MEIRCQGLKVRVVLNGETVVDEDFSSEKYAKPIGKFDIAYNDLPRKGYLGVQNHGGELWFRNLRIRGL